MPDFVKGGTSLGTFGQNKYLRSTVGCKFESYTVAAASVPTETGADGSTQKILQPGTLMSSITSGPDTGKIGPWMPAGTADVWTMTKTGTWSAGTYTIAVTYGGVTATTGAIAFDATAATVQTAVQALSNVGSGNMLVTGGPMSTTAMVFTAAGNLRGSVTVDVNFALVTGTTPGLGEVHTTTGVNGALDGRATLTNIVGLVDTWLPWQLLEGDREVGVLYDGTAVQGWCFELDATNARVALNNTRAAECFGKKGLQINFK
jgi:hypothetical protein